ncbi:MAG: efflux RND transporter periplasmic adaptor subunit [Planctomycetaceae bacterium]|nr:efflux RND transporter periplasmic adaptor subunit [Planctomycetaceae bacterium]
MLPDPNAHFRRESHSSSGSNTLMVGTPFAAHSAPNEPDRANQRPNPSLLLQFSQETAKVLGELRGEAAVVAVTRLFLQILRPAILLHAHLAPSSVPNQSPKYQIDDWLEKQTTIPRATVPVELQSTAVDAIQRCAETGQCQISTVITAHQVVAVPVVVPGQKLQALAIAVAIASSAEALPLAIAFANSLASLQLDGRVLQGQLIAKQLQSLSKNNQDLAAAASLPQAATHLTTRWAESLKVNHVAWVEVRRQRAVRVAGISGSTEIDAASRAYFEMVQATQALLQAGGSTGRWVGGQPAPPKFLQRPNGENLAATPPSNTTCDRCLQSIASELMVPAVLAIPVRSSEQIVAYLFLMGPKEIANPDWEVSQRTLLEPIQVQAALANRVHQTAWQRLIARPSSFIRRWRWWLATSLAIVGLVAAWPLPYSMYCDCELVTTDRRYAVAPYKGTLKDVLVKPGEIVAPGQILATMDDRELKIELAGKQASLEREQNQIKVARAENDIAKARISELEMQRISSEIALLHHHMSNREIRTPIAGTIVQGDLSELSGAPVEIGSNLFEVAGLDELLVQIEIPEYQYRYSTVGQEVRLSLEAFPYETFTGVVERLHPRATTRDERNVFLAEIRLPNLGSKLRPGMKGQACIQGDAYPLAWTWLHYPYEKTRLFLGWY